MKGGTFMNNQFGYYAHINGQLMCFATEAEYYEYLADLENDEKDTRIVSKSTDSNES